LKCDALVKKDGESALSSKKYRTLTILAVVVAFAAVALMVFISNFEDRGRADSDSPQVRGEANIPDTPTTTRTPTAIRTPSDDAQTTVIHTMRDMMFYDQLKLPPLEYETVSRLKRPVGVNGIFMEEGFLFEITHAAVVGNMVYLYYTLEDLVGGRFNEHTSFWVNLRLGGEEINIHEGVALAVNTGFNELGALTFRSRSVFTLPIESQKIFFDLLQISHSHRSGEYIFDIDLSALTPVEAFDHVFYTPILQPHTHLLDITKEGFDFSSHHHNLSAIGIIDGRLHIQGRDYVNHITSNLSSESTSSTLILIDPDGEFVLSLFAFKWPPEPDVVINVNFRLDQFGNIIQREYGFLTTTNGAAWTSTPVSPSRMPTRYFYYEMVFDVDLDRLSEYRLVAGFESFSRMPLDFNWDTSFEIYVSEKVAISTDVNDVEFGIGGGAAVTIEEVITLPTGILINGRMRFEGFRMSNTPALRDGIEVSVNTTEGVLQASWDTARDTATAMGDGVIVNVFSLFYTFDDITDFLPIESVVSVDINGHVIQIA